MIIYEGCIRRTNKIYLFLNHMTKQSEQIIVWSRLRQEDILLPILFNIALWKRYFNRLNDRRERNRSVIDYNL